MNHNVFLCGAMLLALNSGYAQTKNFIDQPYLETTARVDTTVHPNVVYLAIRITEKDERDRVSAEALEQRMADRLVALGIDLETQLTLSDLASNFKKYALRRRGILKDKTYTLKVFDALTAGRVLASLEDIGISNVALERVEYTGREALQLALKTEAVKKARLQAERLVAPLGQKAGAALYISDRFYGYRDGYRKAAMRTISVGYEADEKQKDEPVDIAFEPIKIQSEVTVRFKIE